MSRAMQIKICGITRLEDALLAIDLGAWALGFICYAKSPRYIAPLDMKAIIDALPRTSRPRLVGVFVNETAQRIQEVARISGIDTIQLHGDESSEICEDLSGLRLWKAFRLKSEDQFSLTHPFTPHVEAFLYDAAVAGQYGGTGHLVDWELLDKAPRQRPLLVSGGLNPANALSAWQRFQPLALDLSSGVESSPGLKDPEKLKQLFALLTVALIMALPLSAVSAAHWPQSQLRCCSPASRVAALFMQQSIVMQQSMRHRG